jgi:transcriptional regulator with XRE-family HTH domain
MYGERLRFLRKTRKVPQKDLASLLDRSIRGYQCYESETHEPDIKALILLADFYNVSIDYIVGRKDEV